MFEIKTTAVSLDKIELMKLVRILMDRDEKEALKFVNKTIFERIVNSQRDKLKSYLDTANPVKGFSQHNT